MAVNSKIEEITIRDADSLADMAELRGLFQEYAESMGFTLCFQGFDKEIAGLPGDYAAPGGALLLASCGEEITGCVALRGLQPGICEMKRLYVRPRFRGKGAGLALMRSVMDKARQLGYVKMRLDTLEPLMKDAVAMYRKSGFREIPPYGATPVAGALCMELDL
jgi:GNAT superfamily N-acetyltransferase